MYKFGSKDASEKQKQQEEYDLLLEDQIEFIQAMTMDDTKKKVKDEPKISEHEKKRMDIKETKESLPVYPFRDDLIDAIRAHQVSVTHFRSLIQVIVKFSKHFLPIFLLGFDR